MIDPAVLQRAELGVALAGDAAAAGVAADEGADGVLPGEEVEDDLVALGVPGDPAQAEARAGGRSEYERQTGQKVRWNDEL